MNTRYKGVVYYRVVDEYGTVKFSFHSRKEAEDYIEEYNNDPKTPRNIDGEVLYPLHIEEKYSEFNRTKY